MVRWHAYLGLILVLTKRVGQHWTKTSRMQETSCILCWIYQNQCWRKKHKTVVTHVACALVPHFPQQWIDVIANKVYKQRFMNWWMRMGWMLLYNKMGLWTTCQHACVGLPWRLMINECVSKSFELHGGLRCLHHEFRRPKTVEKPNA